VNYYALLIGVTTTASRPDSIMTHAVPTARAMQTFLESANVPAENIRLLQEPTRDDLDSMLAWLTDAVTTGDTLLVMYVGHGIEGSASASYGWWLTSSDHITSAELATWLDTVSNAARRIVISDCCYGEGITKLPQSTSVLGRICAGLQNALARLRKRLFADYTAMAAQFATQVIARTHTVGVQAPMICIAGAALDREVDDGRERLLMLLTIGAAAAGSTYAELQGDFARVKDGDKGFNIQPTPKELLGERVLGTPGTPVVTPALAVAAAPASKA
jgi:hypothetical protein